MRLAVMMIMTVSIRMAMVMIMTMAEAMAVVVGATMVTSVRIIVKNLHNNEIANETKYTSYEHIERLFNYLLLQHSFSSFNE
jgi:hypothetical protein